MKNAWLCIVFSVLCAGCKTTHQVHDYDPHATVVFITRDIQFSGVRDVMFDRKTVPLWGNVVGPFRIRPGRHELLLERQELVKEHHPVGYWFSLIAFMATPTQQHGHIDWSDSTSEYTNYVERIELISNIAFFYLVDFSQFGNVVESYESWMDLESAVIKRYGVSVRELQERGVGTGDQ